MTSENIRMSSKDGKTESWEKTIRDGNMTKCIRVEKVENGYIVSYNEYGRKAEKSEYVDITKKWISKTNPLEESKEKPVTGIEPVINAIFFYIFFFFTIYFM